MKGIFISVLVIVVLIMSFFIFANGNSRGENTVPVPANNVTIEDGKQIVEIKAKGGYSPRASVAKAGMPTILRFNTNGTFDCSSSVRIPSLNISKSLPATGLTDIELPNSSASTLKGTCGMGMYPFEIDFQS